MLVLLVILFNVIYCSSGLNLTYYPVVVQSTNRTNVSSFEECACQCLSSINCSYFAYWSSISLSPSCQIYSSLDSKPDIISFTLTNYSNQTGLYGITTANTPCQLSVPNISYAYNNNASTYVSTPGKRIISVIILSIGSADRLLAIDYDIFSYFLFDINTFQVNQYKNIFYFFYFNFYSYSIMTHFHQIIVKTLSVHNNLIICYTLVVV